MLLRSALLHRSLVVAILLSATCVVSSTGCADDDGRRPNDDDRIEGPGPDPLKLGNAPAALCAGAASRDDDGTGNETSGYGDGPSAVGAGTGTGDSSSDSSSGSWGTGGSGDVGGFGGQGGSGGAGGGEGGFGGTGGSGGSGGAGGSRGVGGAGGTSEGLGRARSAATDADVCPGVDLATPLKLYLSSDDSNSMASPVIVRDQIAHGAQTISPRLIRTHEFLNYYRYDFAPAPAGEVAITSQLGSCDLSADLALQIAVQSSPSTGRAPMSITLVLDTSGSMDGQPMELQRAAVRAIASTLVAGDVVSAVTWADDQTPIFAGHVVEGADDPRLLALADGLVSNGGTNLDAGLRVGYELAEEYAQPGRLSRVVLISDGQANVGITEEDIIGGAAEDRDGEGIYLVGVGVGPGIDDTLMDVVTDAGRGAYVYLDEPEEARRIFVDRFGETMLVAARDVRIELTLPPYFAIAKFYGEEYSPDPTKVRTQHLAPDDSMMLFQILHPCDASLPRASDPYRVRVTWSDPVTGESRESMQETTLGALGIDDGNLAKAAAVVAYAEALKQLEALPQGDRAAVLDAARATVLAVPGSEADPDLQAIAATLALAAENQSHAPPVDDYEDY